MDFLKNFEILYENFFALDGRMLVMWAIGGILIYLAIKTLLSKRLLSVFSSTAVQKHQFFGTQPALWPDSVFST